MGWMKRWFAMMALGGTLLVSLTNCVVAPVEPGYMAAPPVVVIRPHRPYRHYHYHPYRDYRPYRPHHGYPYGHRW